MVLENNIAVVLYDNSTVAWADLATRMMDFTRFRLADIESNKSNYWVETKDIDHALVTMPEHYKWAVVITSGNMVIDNSIVQKIVDHCKENNSPLAGHIIARHGYYHLHPQFFCINIKSYKQFGQLLIPLPGITSVDSPMVHRSDTNVHDDYTPWWIRPSDNAVISHSVDHDNFAQRYMAWAVSQGHQLVNVPEYVRNQKIYSYVDHSHDDIRKFIVDTTYRPDVYGGISQFLDYMRYAAESLDRGFYVFNTEQFLPVAAEPNSIKIFAGVCGGIKPAMIVAQPAFDVNCKIILFDISGTAIEWQKHLRNTWDGKLDKFQSVFDSFIAQHPDAQPCYFKHLGIDGNIDWFLKDNFTREQVYNAWQRWITLDVEYIQCDLLELLAQRQLLDRVNNLPGTAYIWTSNLFSMDWMMFFYGNEWSKSMILTWLNQVNLGQSIILENLGAIVHSLSDSTIT
jgi:hypothetical protein